LENTDFFLIDAFVIYMVLLMNKCKIWLVICMFQDGSTLSCCTCAVEITLGCTIVNVCISNECVDL
jgi:hypothetical protein